MGLLTAAESSTPTRPARHSRGAADVRQRACRCQVRFGRQDDGNEAASFPPADGEASGPLGTLAEELNGYSRKKGGFSFRFGRR
ncbi:Orexigenic neuropeptide QRFP [Pteropus alecto]|uniref:Orexigenic neuropeptide QRFP n=1 Tax=Pteropus alecto TaxID=9402 RepID=L5K7E1_PTEAL|nr:Orexigenic neuropeptide QRFP [Pteropus alecto]